MNASEPRARQRALCVAAGPAEAQDLDELAELLRTAGVAVVGTLIQRRQHADPNTYLGPGKVPEARGAARACDANLVACEDELSARQERNLEQALGLPVVDRTAVILDIFATHASSAEGKLQVELAQLEYNLARMRGLWSHLERLGGGIGTRGPGESQIETDRRLARDRIAKLRRRLERVKSSRAVMRAERERAGLPRIALAGYTNAGKSTLLNAMLEGWGADTQGRNARAGRAGSRGRNGSVLDRASLGGAASPRGNGARGTVSVADRLFHTLDPTTRAMRVCRASYLLTDTVGFIRKLPHQLVDAFGATLEETVRAELLLHVLDASVPEPRRIEMQGAVEQTLQEIGAGEVPRLLVLSKADLLGASEREELRIERPDATLVSGATGEGLGTLAEHIERELRRTLRPVELLVPYSDGPSLAELHAVSSEVSRRHTPEGVLVRALLPERVAGRFARFSVAPS
jgi:GTP-binding protein HflX